MGGGFVLPHYGAALTDFGVGGGDISPDLEIVLSVSGNFNVFTEKFLQKERKYWVKNT